ncbi:hypothetical protein M0802_013101 [Mischocyttarus mexicanus]|nr:hypothetical protein M0802_013101 [Mischocyttarus mexicanus]
MAAKIMLQAKFDAEHGRILSSCRKTAMDQPYFKAGRYEATMQTYLAGISLLNKCISELAPKTSQARAPGQARFRSSLLNVDLPKFSGAFSEWRPFEDLFSSMVRDNPDISQVQKMHYLRSSLEGDSAKVVANLRLSAESLLSYITSTARALEHIETHRTYREASKTSQEPKATPARAFAKVLKLGSQLVAEQRQASDKPQGHSLPFIPDLSNNCCYCRQRHYLVFCPIFNSLSLKDRIKVVVHRFSALWLRSKCSRPVY